MIQDAIIEAVTYLEGEFTTAQEALAYASGETLRSLFRSCERQGAVIFWGLYTESQLDAVIQA